METQKVEKQKPTHPWKSTTHEERFYHLFQDSVTNAENPDPFLLSRTRFAGVTVFARKETTDGWFISVALYVHDDPAPFSRKVGRGLSRRKYFSSPRHRHPIQGDLTHEKVLETVKGIILGAMHPPGHVKPYPGRV